jgi:hypothetical protein
MRTFPRAVAAAVTALVVAGCVGGPTGTTQPSPTLPAQPTPDAGTYWLRAMTTQALAPLNVFGSLPVIVITGDGVAVRPGAVPAIFPGPAVVPLTGRSITEAGRLAIVNAATVLGLLGGKGDFTGGQVAMGGITGRIELTVDGRRVTITGSPDIAPVCGSTTCNPPAGTPAAFAELWRRLGNLESWIGPELGTEHPYAPVAYAVLVGPAPVQDPQLPQPPMVWPLASQMMLFGGPVANGQARCGTVSGADVAPFAAALARANALTQWHQDASTNATLGLTVRPMVPGEDACRETFGPA